MHKQTSEATQIRTLKRELKESEKERWNWKRTANSYERHDAALRAELTEWKERFDILLRREENK